MLYALLFLTYYLSDSSRLPQATLHSMALSIAGSLSHARDPSQDRLYRQYSNSYAFRAFDGRLVAKRHLLASANAEWLKSVVAGRASETFAGSDRDPMALRSDLEEGFALVRSTDPKTLRVNSVYILTHRVVLSGHKYWIQVVMRADPAWVSAGVIFGELDDHVVFPILFLVPALTLTIFLTMRSVVRPLHGISRAANMIGHAVERGQSSTPLPEYGMVREFHDVAVAMNTMLSRLNHSLQSQKQFISEVAHELRTPLSVLLLEVAHLPPDASRNRIKTDLQNLGNLVNELLRFAQAEDVLAQEREEVDVSAIARKVCEESVSFAIQRQQLLELNGAGHPNVTMGNSTLIEIAIRNLVENALKYSPRDSTVTVTVTRGPTVTVEDCGPGVPLSQRDTIFERFWRADAEAVNGAGVGLALVRRILQLHDGRVWLEARPEGGARFILNFRELAFGREPIVGTSSNDQKGAVRQTPNFLRNRSTSERDCQLGSVSLTRSSNNSAG